MKVTSAKSSAPETQVSGRSGGTDAASINEQIKEVGDRVRKMKAEKADKVSYLVFPSAGRSRSAVFEMASTVGKHDFVSYYQFRCLPTGT